ncbi:1-phosphatidylinositol-3-phosphate 5-kinase [Actinomortierella ambigua]|uniref:1-phosphatidylinositol-3-phosphate 5-kinase n=1 Tax=Actinomortierella ambigua TaxID=1343610 RepID=A0A9P6QJJ0_9FUNG|nr:1-phosphatidylinositol-3-phosphate 5-kinase [Actinomortierella ambigua]
MEQSMTSFAALHEPPSVQEDPPENVLSKLFQRVKNTLSSSAQPSPSPPSSSSLTTSQSQQALSSAGSGSALSSHSGIPLTQTQEQETAAGGEGLRGGGHAHYASTGSLSSADSSSPSTPSSKAASAEPPHGRTPSMHSTSSSSMMIASTLASSSTSGSGLAAAPSINTIENPQHFTDSTSPSSLRSGVSSASAVTTTTEPRVNSAITRMGRTHQYSSKRTSSLFKVSTMDQSIVHDEDASLAPPVVSLSAAFGDGQFSKNSNDGSSSRDYMNHAFAAMDSSYDSDSRSVKSFSSVQHKGNSLTRAIRRLRGEGVNKDYWMADENCKECFGCSAPFSMLRRKHHCRICGNAPLVCMRHIFCAKCASRIIPGSKLGYEGSLRVCYYCHKIMQEYEEEGDTFDYNGSISWAPQTPSLPHGHFPAIGPPPGSPGPSYTQEAAPLDGIRKFLHAGSNLFMARSRSNTATADIHLADGQPAPFRRSIALEDGAFQDSVLDPEIAPFMGDDDDDERHDLWASASPTNTPGFLTLHGVQNSSRGFYGDDDDYDSDKELHEMAYKDGKLHLRPQRADDVRDMFAKDRSPAARRISGAGTRTKRTPSLKTRGIMRVSNASETLDRLRSPMDIRPSSPYLPGVNSTPPFLMGRHSRAASVVSAAELNAVSLQHMRHLLRQLLKRFEIESGQGWDDVIMKLVLKVSNNIQLFDSMDIMHAVKIKKIPGGTAQDSMYIDGVVCTKNLAHKQMSRTLHSPRILILTFALEYQRVENHFISLGPVVDQEREYLQNLVARIVAFSPHVIVVEKTISRIALEMLLKHNVAVIYNVKPEVCAAIAHCTGADIILSFDKLVKEPRLGKCGLFTVKTYVHELIPNKRRSYIFFQDCPKDLFCTIVLRGGSLETLNRIKKIVRLMVWVSYNLKLETSLMKDEFAMTSTVADPKVDDKDDPPGDQGDQEAITLQQMIKPYKQTILSASPLVRFEPPFLLTRMIEDEEKLRRIEHSTLPGALREFGNCKICFASVVKANTMVSKAPSSRNQDSAVIEASYIDVSNDYRSKQQAWEDFLNTNIRPDLISPFAYQNLAFLFSNYCTVTKTTCVGPAIRLIQFYHADTDVTLGHYLEQICWESVFICPSDMCDCLLRDHQRIYAHGDAKIIVSVEAWNSITPGMENTITMWSQCRICHVETPQVLMSDDSRSYSFGKFLELIFYQADVTCRANICPHDINRDHIRYFGIGELLVKMERVQTRLFDINFPSMLVRCKPDYAVRSKNLDLDIVRSLITRYWDSVMERIKNCIFDVVQPSKIEAAKQELLEMSRMVVLEKKSTLQLLQQTYLNSAPTDNLALNLVRIKLHEKAVQWDKTFGAFARDYFNPDRDYRRGPEQLRRLFNEKDLPVIADRIAHAGLDLPLTLDTTEEEDSDRRTAFEDEFVPTDLPFLGSSPTEVVLHPKVESGDVAALEDAIENAANQVSFPFMEPKVTRRLSMNLMQEFRPKLTHTNTAESLVTVTQENSAHGKTNGTGSNTGSPGEIVKRIRTPEPSTLSLLPRIPLPISSRPTSRVSSRFSMVSLPTFDPSTLLSERPPPSASSSITAKSTRIGSVTRDHSQFSVLGTPTASAHPSPPLSSRGTPIERPFIPLDRTPTHEKSSPGLNAAAARREQLYRTKPRRPVDSAPPASASGTSAFSSGIASSTVFSPEHPPNHRAGSSISTSTSNVNVSNRRSQYLAQAQANSNVATSSASSTEPTGRQIVGNRNRAVTQPIPGATGNARSRYLSALTRSRGSVRPMETKEPIIEVFSSVKEAAKEESDDEQDDYLSEGEGDEPYHPSRGYTFSMIQTDAMDEALGSEEPSSEVFTRGNSGINLNGSSNAGGAGGAQTGADGSSLDDPFLLFDPTMMFLGDDDTPHGGPQDGSQAMLSSSDIGTSLVSTGSVQQHLIQQQQLRQFVGSPPIKSSTMSVTGTLNAALAAAKLPGLMEVAEGVERGSIIKTLSNFWQERNSPNFTPLEYPLQPSEHVFGYSQIIAREDEPSSIIALTLSSPQYVDKLKGLFSRDNETETPAPLAGTGPSTSSSEETFDTSPSYTFGDGIYDHVDTFEESLLSESSTHMKFPFIEGSTMLYCKIFYMEQFHALRKSSGCDYSYIQSLARCMKWDASGGKSGSSFLKTRDDRFIMKQLSKVELEAFIKFAPHYFEYMHKAIYHKLPTVLAKIFGFYRVGYKNGALGRTMNMDVLIMENLFYDRKNLQVYDLKGSRRNRFVQPSGKENEVFLDENFIRFMSESPFFIREHAKMQLSESLANDSLFLQRFNIMDYSLLVAVDDDKQELIVGIVDFIRPFTWDKKLESWVKDAVGSKEPTIVSPAQYRKRFRAAMNRHLDMVPDRWFNIDAYFNSTMVHRGFGAPKAIGYGSYGTPSGGGSRGHSHTNSISQDTTGKGAIGANGQSGSNSNTKGSSSALVRSNSSGNTAAMTPSSGSGTDLTALSPNSTTITPMSSMMHSRETTMGTTNGEF